MKVINADVEFITPINGAVILQRLEQCGRVCYKSEDKITDTSAEAFVRGIIRRGHEAVLEHCSFTVKFICDRGISHEIVRHRMASFCQESTRYCNYSKDKFDGELTFIKPCFWDEHSDQMRDCYDPRRESLSGAAGDGSNAAGGPRRAAEQSENRTGDDRKYPRVAALPESPL